MFKFFKKFKSPKYILVPNGCNTYTLKKYYGFLTGYMSVAAKVKDEEHALKIIKSLERDYLILD